MTARWSAVDSPAADLLAELGGPADTEATDAEWRHFVASLRAVAQLNGGLVHQNVLRDELRDQVHPKRIGSFYRRALLEGRLEITGMHDLSDDVRSRNRGRPCRVYRWKESQQ